MLAQPHLVSGWRWSAMTASWSTGVVPRQVRRAVPLARLGLLVEPVQLGRATLVVVPGELGVARRPRPVPAVGVLLADDGEDGLEVVDLGAADDLGVVRIAWWSCSISSSHALRVFVGDHVLSAEVVGSVARRCRSSVGSERETPGSTKRRTRRRTSCGSVRSAPAGRTTGRTRDAGGPLRRPGGLVGRQPTAEEGPGERAATASRRSMRAKARYGRTTRARGSSR